MNPACEIPEYASIRTTFVWRSATTLPIVIDSAARIHISGRTTSGRSANPMITSCSRATNPAALDDTERNAVIGVGAPSYVSGAHVWNGTADTLKPDPGDPEDDAQRYRRRALCACQGCADVGQLGAARHAVEQRHAVQQHAGGQHPHQVVLGARLVPLGI